MKKRIFTLCMVLGWMVVIFSFSAQNADESGALSEFLSEKIVILQNEVLQLGWTKQKIMEISIWLEKPLRKMAHASEYAVLGFLVGLHLDSLRSAPGEPGSGRLRARLRRALEHTGVRVMLGELICVLYAAGDEFHQLFVEERSGQIGDVCIDGAGALAGILISVGVLAWMRRHRRRHPRRAG